jgi:hypothetical protein
VVSPDQDAQVPDGGVVPGELVLYEILHQHFDALQAPQGVEMHAFRSPTTC